MSIILPMQQREELKREVGFPNSGGLDQKRSSSSNVGPTTCKGWSRGLRRGVTYVRGGLEIRRRRGTEIHKNELLHS